MTISIFDKPNGTRTRFAIAAAGRSWFFSWSSTKDLSGGRLSMRVRHLVHQAFQKALRSNHDWNSPQPFLFEA